MRKLRHVLVVGLSIVAVAAGLGASSAGAEAPGAARGEFIVVLKPGASRANAVAAARAAGGEVLFQYRHALDGFAVTLPAIAVGGIERNPNVLSVSESSELHAAAPTPPPAENPQVLQRSVDRIDAEASSARSGDGRGSVETNVAVLDSGIDSGPSRSERGRRRQLRQRQRRLRGHLRPWHHGRGLDRRARQRDRLRRRRARGLAVRGPRDQEERLRNGSDDPVRDRLGHGNTNRRRSRRTTSRSRT